MDPMIVALGGSSSAYVSWSESTMSPWWEGATQNLLFGLLRRWPVVLATTALCNEDMGCVVPDTGARFGVFGSGSEAHLLTLYDVPSLLDPESRVRLMDGARIEAFGAPGDGTNDNLRIVVSLIGIIDPALTSLDSIDVANLYNLRFFIDGQDVGSDNLGSPQGVGAGTTFLGDATYEYSFIAELPFDVDPDGTETTLRVAVDLAEGGTSEYEVDVAVDILCSSTPNGVIVPFELPPDALYQGSAGADALPGTDAWRVGSLEAAYDFVRAAMIAGGYGGRDVYCGQPPNEPDAKAFGMMGVGECWRGGVVFFAENSTTPPTMTIWDGRTRP
jgi:hypothetical protein